MYLLAECILHDLLDASTTTSTSSDHPKNAYLYMKHCQQASFLQLYGTHRLRTALNATMESAIPSFDV
jgi:hypothetical protein